MKQLKIPILFLILLFTISCSKDDQLKSSDFRIKMELVYYNNQLENKTAYSYIDNQVGLIESFINPFNGSFPNFSNAMRYEYNGNIVNATFLTYVGNQVTSGDKKELEFNDGLMIRNNNELFTYNNGLLIERLNPESTKSTYEYENGNLIRITSYRYMISTSEYLFYEKYEFAYIDEQVTANRYSYNTKIAEWKTSGKIDYFFSGNLLIRKVWYSADNITVSSSGEYQYDERGNLILVTGSNGSTSNYVNTYDEFDNLTEVDVSFSPSGDSRKYLNYYELGKTNNYKLIVPVQPYTYYSNFKRNSNE